ncbi:gamma-glutamyl-gamma-aminobutyrate hydrolase family protein [Undibacterium sp. YM2]|uniref:gamma-glutamyl-gamma-aminobutyrate hydrolase family protein n=1 Tax=Undibacterium sp. YM2 TaxID=2058625 RepID=UPI00351B8BA3
MPDEKNDQAQQNTPHSGIVPPAGGIDSPANLPANTASGNQAEQATMSPSAITVTQAATAAKEPADRQAPSTYLADESPWRTMIRVITARLRATSMRTAKGITQRTLKIGVSARIFHPQTGAKGLSSKTLQYLEESIAQWVMARDVMVFMIPSVNTNGLIRPSNIRLRDYARHLDGLVLQGGADVAPESYSQQSTRPEWNGDRTRDMYELELLHEFIEADKPLLGICRGCQLLNVAFGGSLYQDIVTEVPGAIAHVNDLYDQHGHELQFTPQSSLAALFPPGVVAKVNSIHHQSIKNLGRDIKVEAISPADNIVEAIRYQKAKFVVGLQWHPEFHLTGQSGLLDCTPYWTASCALPGKPDSKF